MKTKLENINNAEWSDNGDPLYDSGQMQEYSDQTLAEYKRKLKEEMQRVYNTDPFFNVETNALLLYIIDNTKP